MSIFNPNTSDIVDIYKKGRFKLAWRLSVVFTVLFAILAGIFSTIEFIGFCIYSIVFLLSVFCLFYLHFKRDSSIVFWTFTIGASVLVIFSINVILDTMHYSDLLWIMCIILFAYIGLSFKAAIFFVIVHSISLMYYVAFGLNTHIQLIIPRANIELFVVGLEMLLAFLVMSYLIHQNIRYQMFVHKELEESNAKLAAQNTENITLLKEVHHRVKNNLQIVVSLLRMQSNELKTEEAKIQFKVAMNRIMTISMIHQKLYQTGELSNLQFKKYLHDLVEDIEELHKKEGKIIMNVASELNEVNLNSIVPIGLIINELITNSIKHAFGGQDEGSISIDIRKIDANLAELHYSDSGVWNESGVEGFGSELIQLLTEQIDGTLERNSSDLIFRFPI